MAPSLAGVSCLVTGAGGFLGQRVVELLLAEEEALAEIRLMDLAFSPKLLKTCDEYCGKTKLQLLKGDIQDAEFLMRACHGLSLVIHTAAIIDTLGTVPTEKLMGVNVRGTQLLLDACIENSVKYYVYTSSLEVLGPNSRGDPVINGSEDLVYESTNHFPYAQSKSMAEKCVLQANGQKLNNGASLVTCALRCMYIFGEESQFLSVLLDGAINNGDVFQRYSRKEAAVNPSYVGNVAWAHIQAAKAMKDPERVARIAGRFYYISDDTPHMSYSDLNFELGRGLGFGVESKMRLPLPLMYVLAFVLEMLSLLLSPFMRYVPPTNRHLINLQNTPFTFSYKNAQKDFDYKPRYSWEDAKQITTKWLASQVPLRKEFLKHHKKR
ncbi:3 beta-hydroxysteroid dehydrogenase/Delta 5--_4-isomerase-like [Ambystoma mexicanum]|uniref:3 beta-hydroxysteroid dehydrogenase/Delta 5-->4-isomerase-like n=1 Tax=Ambystoma mexicanum TaxID=8296 RepID=UPI0037E99C95